MIRIRHPYVPLADIKAGMTLGQPTEVVHRGFLSLALPTGHILTEENINQLSAHHAEYICVDLPDTREDEQVAEDVAQAVGRVLKIFEGADLTDANMVAFLDQVLAYRSA